MHNVVALLNSLGPVITAATPVLVIVVNWLITRRQSRDLKEHGDRNATKISNAMIEATGSHKTLPDA